MDFVYITELKRRQSAVRNKNMENNTVPSYHKMVQVVTLPQLTILIPSKLKDQDKSNPVTNKLTQAKSEKPERKKNTEEIHKHDTSHAHGTRNDFKEIYNNHKKVHKESDRNGKSKNSIPVFYVSNNFIAFLGSMNKATNDVHIQVPSLFTYKSPLTVHIVKRVISNVSTNRSRNRDKIEHKSVRNKPNTENAPYSRPNYNPLHTDPSRMKESLFTTKSNSIVNNKVLETMLSNVLNLVRNNIQRASPEPNVQEPNSSNITFINNSDDLFSAYFVVKNIRLPLGIFNRSTLNEMMKDTSNSTLFNPYKSDDSVANGVLSNVQTSDILKSLNNLQSTWKNYTFVRKFDDNGRQNWGLLGNIELTTQSESSRFNSFPITPRNFLKKLENTTVSVSIIKKMAKEYPILMVLRKKPKITVVSPHNPLDSVSFNLNDKRSIDSLFNNGNYLRTQRKALNVLGVNDNLGKQLCFLNEVEPLSELHSSDGILFSVQNTHGKASQNTNPIVLSFFLDPNELNNSKTEPPERPNVPTENANVVFYYSKIEPFQKGCAIPKHPIERVSIRTNIHESSSSKQNLQTTIDTCDINSSANDNMSRIENSERFPPSNVKRALDVNKNQRKFLNLPRTKTDENTTSVGEPRFDDHPGADVQANKTPGHGIESSINCNSRAACQTSQKASEQNTIMTAPPAQFQQSNQEQSNRIAENKCDPHITGSPTLEDKKRVELKVEDYVNVIHALDMYCPSRTVKYSYMLYLLPCIFNTTEYPHFKQVNNSRATRRVHKRMAIGKFALWTPATENNLYVNSPKFIYEERKGTELNHKSAEKLMRESNEFGIVCAENELLSVLESISQPRSSLITQVGISSMKPLVSGQSTVNNYVCDHAGPQWLQPFQPHQKNRIEDIFTHNPSTSSTPGGFPLPNYVNIANQYTTMPSSNGMNDQHFINLSRLFKLVATTPQISSMNPTPGIFQQKRIAFEDLTNSYREKIPCEHSIKMNPATQKLYQSQAILSTSSQVKTPSFESFSLPVPPSWQWPDFQLAVDSTRELSSTTYNYSCTTPAKDLECTIPVDGIQKCPRHNLVKERNQQQSEVTRTLTPHDVLPESTFSTSTTKSSSAPTVTQLATPYKRFKSASQYPIIGFKNLSTLPCLCAHVNSGVRKDFDVPKESSTQARPRKWLFKRPKNRDQIHNNNKKTKKEEGNI